MTKKPIDWFGFRNIRVKAGNHLYFVILSMLNPNILSAKINFHHMTIKMAAKKYAFIA